MYHRFHDSKVTQEAEMSGALHENTAKLSIIESLPSTSYSGNSDANISEHNDHLTEGFSSNVLNIKQEINEEDNYENVQSNPVNIYDKGQNDQLSNEFNLFKQVMESIPLTKERDQYEYHCKYCNLIFNDQSHLRSHLRTHSKEKPYKCTECPSTFTQLSNLRTHMKLHTGEKPYVCDVCSVAFTQSSNLKSHKLIHSGERPYKCDLCPAAFVQSTHLTSHKRRHTGERPYACDTCDASFAQLSNLKSHKLRHTGIKPYKCEQCESTFAQKSNLKKHVMRIHSDITLERLTKKRKSMPEQNKSFPCDVCGAEFSLNSNLKIHYRIHTGDKSFKCRWCDAKFIQKSNLLAHEVVHNNDEPFKCVKCPSAFKLKNRLKSHLIKVHSVQGEELDFLLNNVGVSNDVGLPLEPYVEIEYEEENKYLKEEQSRYQYDGYECQTESNSPYYEKFIKHHPVEDGDL